MRNDGASLYKVTLTVQITVYEGGTVIEFKHAFYISNQVTESGDRTLTGSQVMSLRTENHGSYNL